VLRGLQSTGVKIYWGYAVSEIHLAHTGFLSSVEVKKASTMLSSDGGSSTMGESKSNSRSILNYSRDDEDDDYDYRPQQEAGIMLACLALLCCSQPQCSRDIFNAINDCGLVYDGGLVVDSVCMYEYLLSLSILIVVTMTMLMIVMMMIVLYF